MQTVVVTFKAGEHARAIIDDVLGREARIVYLTDVGADDRRSALGTAEALLARNTGIELDDAEHALIERAKLIQFLSAGVDYIPLDRIPPGVPIASNAGAYAEPMAEHGLAMTLAAAKGLLREHRNLEKGQFNQFQPKKTLRGATVGILGFGGIGKAAARLFRCLGAEVHAINRGGRTDEPVDFCGTPADIPTLLPRLDVLLITLPLTQSTRGLIGATELAAMKPDAILVNLARGEIIDETALFEHLKANPSFTACIDAWWVEPVRHGEFRMDRPFLSLPNVIGSPHNSAAVPGTGDKAMRLAAENVRRALRGEEAWHVLGPDDMPPR